MSRRREHELIAIVEDDEDDFFFTQREVRKFTRDPAAGYFVKPLTTTTLDPIFGSVRKT